MENTTAKKAVDTTIAITLEERLAKLPIKDPNFAKVARLVNKGINESVELSKFMNLDFDGFLKQLPASIRNQDAVAKRIEALEILTNVNSTRNALEALSKELVDMEVQSKADKFSGLKLDEEDQKRLANQLTIYRKALMHGVHNSIPFKRAYGVNVE